MPKEQRAAVVKIEGHKTGIIHRFASEQKSLHPKPDLPRSALIYLSTRNIDADGDIVLPSGWDLSLYRGQGLWSHDYKADPIYKAVENGTDEIGLWQLIQFADNERGENYWNMVKDGYLRTFSAGIWPKQGGCIPKGDASFPTMCAQARTWPEFTQEHEAMCQRFIREKWLVESSLCNVPSNPYALVMAVSKGQVRLCDEVRAAIGFEAIEKKCRDAGHAAELPPQPAAKSAVVVKAVPVTVRLVPHIEVMSSPDIESMVEKSLQKCVAKLRGRV
jgi:phage head maturation protease